MWNENFLCFSIREIRTEHEVCTFLVSDLDLMTLCQGHDTPFGHKQSLWELRIFNVSSKERYKPETSFIPPPPNFFVGGITINRLGHELKNIRNNTSLTVGLSIDFCDFSIDYYTLISNVSSQKNLRNIIKVLNFSYSNQFKLLNYESYTIHVQRLRFFEIFIIHSCIYISRHCWYMNQRIYIHTILLLCGLSPLVLLSSDLLPVAASSRREHPNIMHGVLSVI